MSCIRFNTPAQRRQMAAAAPRPRTPEEVAADLGDPIPQSAPPVTDSKVRRLRLLAESADPRIRASAAASSHLPADVRARLARDPDPTVRAWVARSEATSCDLLRELATDADETVRGFVAVNWFVPDDAMERLADDPSATVRGLVAWKDALREREGVAV